jgi:superfamily II DNA helicase RecQ
MMTKVLTLRFNPLHGAFDDQPLIDFTRDKDLIAVHHHFFTYDGVPYLAIVLDYRLGELLNPEESQDSRRRREDHWRETLSKNALPLFNTLRQWRAARAKAEGIPSYQIANNRQLAEMAESRPQSLTALAKLEGFGQARISKYGQEMLDLLSKVELTSPEPSGNEPGVTKEPTSGE